ncbi:DUF6328 family protein [Nocardia sp. NPDC050697]|uniref:DUF6328 family protein n=1 Tax=Nocardia sp. NPDC050697 TaxID=3155158 RepID=UPI0033DEA942
MTGNHGGPQPRGDRTEDPQGDAWNWQARGETATERLDRNFGQLLQELRVLQTGVQLLTGLLLILPFQDGFEDLGGAERGIYLAAVTFAMAATVVLVAPVSWHRVLFRRRRLEEVVTAAHRCALTGLLLLGLALTAVVVLIVAAVIGMVAAALAGAVTGLLFLTVWLLVPLRYRRPPLDQDRREPAHGHTARPDPRPGDDAARPGPTVDATLSDTASTSRISRARRRSGLLPRPTRRPGGRARRTADGNGGAPNPA